MLVTLPPVRFLPAGAFGCASYGRLVRPVLHFTLGVSCFWSVGVLRHGRRSAILLLTLTIDRARPGPVAVLHLGGARTNPRSAVSGAAAWHHGAHMPRRA